MTRGMVIGVQARLGMSKIFLEPAGPGMPLTGRVHLAGPPETMDVAMEALQAMFQVPVSGNIIMCISARWLGLTWLSSVCDCGVVYRSASSV